MTTKGRRKGVDSCYSGLDSGWAWIVLLASFGSFVLIGGTMYAVGIIHIALLERFKEDVFKTAVVGAIHSATMCLGGPISTALIDRFSCRAALVTSGCLYAVGYVATAFAPNVEVCIFTCGILAGCGGAAGYTAAMVVIGFNFRKRLNIAMGLAVSGVGAGMFIMAPLIEFAREYYGNSGFFIILAGLTLHMIVFGMACFPSSLELHTKRKRKREIKRQTQGGCSNLYSTICFYLHVAVKKPVLCLCLSLFNFGLGTFMIYLHLPNYAAHKGSTSIQGSLLVSISGIMTMIGRFLSGLAANSEDIDDILLYAGSMGVVSLATLLFPLYSSSFEGQAFYSAILGLYCGCCYVLSASVNIKFVGIKCMSAALGLEFCLNGLGLLVGPILAGWMVDNGGTYEQSFTVAGFFMLSATIFALATVFLSMPQDNELKTSDKEIEILAEKIDSQLCDKAKLEPGTSSSYNSELLIGNNGKEEDTLNNIGDDTHNLEFDPQIVQSTETNVLLDKRAEVPQHTCTYMFEND